MKVTIQDLLPLLNAVITQAPALASELGSLLSQSQGVPLTTEQIRALETKYAKPYDEL